MHVHIDGATFTLGKPPMWHRSCVCVCSLLDQSHKSSSRTVPLPASDTLHMCINMYVNVLVEKIINETQISSKTEVLEKAKTNMSSSVKKVGGGQHNSTPPVRRHGVALSLPSAQVPEKTQTDTHTNKETSHTEGRTRTKECWIVGA